MKIYFGIDSYGVECVMLKVGNRKPISITSKAFFETTPTVFFEILSEKLTKEVSVHMAETFLKTILG